MIIKLNSSGALPINCKSITEYSNCLILFVFLYFFSKNLIFHSQGIETYGQYRIFITMIS